MKNIRKIVCTFLMAMALMMIVSSSAKAAEGYTTATALGFGSDWGLEHWITSTNTEDWYIITIPSDGMVDFRIMSYMDDDCHWEFYNQDFSKTLYSGSVYYGNNSSPVTKTCVWNLSSGVYYLKVYGDAGKYKLFADYTSFSSNDAQAISYDSPQNYSVGSQIVGAITATDSEDWYRISITKNSYYVFNVKSYMDDDCYWELYNNDLSKTITYGSVYYGKSSVPVTKNYDNIVLTAGTYYLKMYGDAGRYIFTLSELTQGNCNHDYQTTYYNATYFKQGYRLHKCSRCGASYKDNYTAKKKLSQGYIYSYSYAGKGKVYLRWSTVSDATGYQIRYTKNKKFKSGVVTKNIKGKSKWKKTISKLSRKKKYYVQVRAYKKSGNKIVYGKWSGKRAFKIK